MIEAWITQLRKGLMEYCVLSVLSRGELYGYALVQALRGAELLAVSESTVYPILARLKDEKYLKVRDVSSDSGPPRRYFALTAAGRLRLAAMHAYWDQLALSINDLRQPPAKDDTP